MDEVDVIIAGGGVIGLALGRAFALRGQSTIVMEGEAHFGGGISSRNSEVIHAGIYYPEGSLKAQTCVQGRELLYDYLRARNLPHRRCGKFIVATSKAQIAKLQEIEGRAQQAGVFDLQWRSTSEVLAEEPEVACVAALWSPSTGIIDSHAYMQALHADIDNHDGIFIPRTPVDKVVVRDAGGFEVHTGGQDPFIIQCSTFINAAGLGANSLAAKIEGLERKFVPPLYYARGSYFGLAGKQPFSRLIYPVPEAGGLGVHVTLDLAGQVRFGPDVEWIENENYDLDPRRALVFYEAIRRYYPSLADGALVPGYTGIRPKLKGKDEGDSDFVISDQTVHGVAGLVNLFGIESPGLTASLALANIVANAVP